MTDTTKIPESILRVAEQHGLTKALKLFPDGMKAATERGQKPLGTPSQGVSPTASPASVFNPARFEQKP